ncbi:hypothetical protein M2140_001958 [Clostridiales Family XIII bacterium PM5-7]
MKRFLKRNMFNIPFVIALVLTMGIMGGWEMQDEMAYAEKENALPYVLTVQEQIELKCYEYGIDPEIPLAIAKLETGHFTSKAFLQHNNVGGLSVNDVPLAYDTVAQGVNAFVSNLANNYFDQGLNTVEKIANKYCPPNASKWTTVVNQLLKEEQK